uniref:C2H2-type domain-containing protein n=1 Tax=Trichogramma kaykai TaxID=54128 RepID=A0ABD2VWT1_9HYME
METRKNRVKFTPNNMWPDAGKNYVFDSVDSGRAKNFKTFPFCKSSANHMRRAIVLLEKLDERLLIDFKSKYVKPKLKSISTTISKSEHRRYPSTKKIDNHIKTNDLIDKELIVLIRNQFNYDTNFQFQVNQQLKIAHKINSKSNIDKVHIQSKTFKCEICQKSFGHDKDLKSHVMAVHILSNFFQCHLCQESFRHKNILQYHISEVHNLSQHFKCDICHKSFGFRDLRKHIMAVHIFNEPLKCEICYKLFEHQDDFKIHIMTVHICTKPFLCDICHMSFGYQENLKKHIAVHI